MSLWNLDLIVFSEKKNLEFEANYNILIVLSGCAFMTNYSKNHTFVI